jgi:predicted glycosyltransferase involved in capsule biosynthesis
VDCDSTDGLDARIADWLPAFPARVHYYKAKPAPYSSPIAKNFAARLSSGDYLFNLDADNFIGDMSSRIRLHGRDEGVCCDVFKIGAYGRIGCARKIFEFVGGYDESFLPAAKHDVDLKARCGIIGYNFINVLPDIHPIPNTKIDTVWNFDSNLSWAQMLAGNTAKMQQNLAARNYRPNTNMTPGEFVHNFEHTVRLTEEFKHVIR